MTAALALDEFRDAISVQEAAGRVGLSKSTLYRMIAEGTGPRARRVGGRLVILAADWDKFLFELPVYADEADRNVAEGLKRHPEMKPAEQIEGGWTGL